jgi:hypothetical protein
MVKIDSTDDHDSDSGFKKSNAEIATHENGFNELDNVYDEVAKL